MWPPAGTNLPPTVNTFGASPNTGKSEQVSATDWSSPPGINTALENWLRSIPPLVNENPYRPLPETLNQEVDPEFLQWPSTILSPVSLPGDEDDEEDPIDHYLDPQSLCPRNILLHDARGNFGGFHQRGTISITTAYRWLALILVTEEPWMLRSSDGFFPAISRFDTSILLIGNYDVVDHSGRILHTNLRPGVQRIYRLVLNIEEPGTRVDQDFRNAILGRDGTSVFGPDNWESVIAPNPHIDVSDLKVPDFQLGNEDWEDSQPLYHALRIFPVGLLPQWLPLLSSSSLLNVEIQQLIQQWNGLANGLTVTSQQQQMFETYQLAVDVEDNYRVVQLSPHPAYFFPPETRLHLPMSCADRPSDELLRQHFHSALLHYVVGLQLSGDFQWRDMCERFAPHGFSNLRSQVFHEGVGKRMLEHYLFTKLYGCLPGMLDEEDEFARWSDSRRKVRTMYLEYRTPPPEEEDWPDRYLEQSARFKPSLGYRRLMAVAYRLEPPTE